MPELAEVETIKSGITPLIKNRAVEKIDICTKSIRYPLNINNLLALEGKTITSILRRGKYLLWLLNDHSCLMIHFGMSGTLSINPKTELKHTHVIFTLSSGNRLVYKDPRRFGMIACYQNLDDFETEKKLGIEPFSVAMTAEYLYQQLKKCHRSIKASLMDQKFIAGLGNIYVNEVLFEAKISPFKPSDTIGKKAACRLYQAITSVLTKAIQSGGSTLKDHRKVDGNLGYFQHQFKVYNCDGQACSRCLDQNTIIKTKQNQRSTFYCPGCQI